MKKAVLLLACFMAFTAASAQNFLTVTNVTSSSITFQVDNTYILRDILGNEIMPVSDPRIGSFQMSSFGVGPQDVVMVSDSIDINQFFGSNPVTTFTVSGLEAGKKYKLAVRFIGWEYHESLGQSEFYEVTMLSGTASVDDDKVIELKVFPNPTDDLVTIEGLEIGTAIKVLDVTGKSVLQLQVTQSSTTVSLANLPGGMYIAQIGNITRRIVKR